jgi:intracellular multiplication protein IcmT
MAKELENLQEKMNWHWRNSMRPVRFINFDGRAAIPLPVLLLFPRTSTFLITLAFLFFFRYLETKGLTFPASIRNFRAWTVGRERPGWLRAQNKKFTDYG